MSWRFSGFGPAPTPVKVERTAPAGLLLNDSEAVPCRAVDSLRAPRSARPRGRGRGRSRFQRPSALTTPARPALVVRCPPPPPLPVDGTARGLSTVSSKIRLTTSAKSCSSSPCAACSKSSGKARSSDTKWIRDLVQPSRKCSTTVTFSAPGARSAEQACRRDCAYPSASGIGITVSMQVSHDTTSKPFGTTLSSVACSRTRTAGSSWTWIQSLCDWRWVGLRCTCHRRTSHGTVERRKLVRGTRALAAERMMSMPSGWAR